MQKSIKVISNKADKSILLTLEKPFFSLIFQLDSSPVFRGGRVKLLHAPIRPVTINNGIPFTSWYDIKSFGGIGQEKDRYNLD